MKTLRDIIKEKGVTNRVVSDALEISETNIRRYDDLSKRNIDELSKIARAIGITLSELISEGIGLNIETSVLDSLSQYDKEVNQPFYSIKGRFIKYADSLQLELNDFYKKCGLNINTDYEDYYLGITIGILLKISKLYPRLNMDWLLTGDGDMIKSSTNKESLSSSDLVDYLIKENDNLKRENRNLIEQNGFYKGLLDKNDISYKQTS